MPKRFKQKPSGAVLMAALAAAFPLAGHAAGAARVDFATGDVKALAPDGRSRPLAKGAEVNRGETVDTGSGRAQLRFSDGAQVSLAPQTQFRVDDYRFEGQADGSEKGLFSLLKGGLRTITGIIGRNNRENYKLTTSVATIGIRGTEFAVAYTNSINVTTGEGSIEVCNAAGCLILNSGETAYVADANTQPVMTDRKTELPPPPAEESPIVIVGNETTADGSPTALPGEMPSGSGYSFAYAGYRNGSPDIYIQSNGVATFDAGGLLSYEEVGYSLFSRGTSAGRLTDGILGWGRWATADQDEDGETYEWQHLHYVVGIPTSSSDMSDLSSTYMSGTYSLTGYTHPTNASGPLAAGTLTGSITAYFSGSVYGDISYSGNDAFDFTWSATISGSSFTGGYLSIHNTYVQGFFAGTNASRAGLVYQHDTGGALGIVNGAAVFNQICLGTGSGC